jgi:cytochrome c peroxidase
MSIFRPLRASSGKALAILATALLLGCSGMTPENGPPTAKAEAETSQDSLRATALSVFKPLPAATPQTPEMVDLGRKLFFDPRLSKSGTISCNSCHSLTRYGADGEPTSEGHQGQRGGRNSPTVYNAHLQFAQFWDGRSPNVEDQAQGPVLNPIEMAMPDEASVARALEAVPEYRQAFAALFPDDKQPVSLRNAAIAIGAFERGLITPSRFDSYLAGDETALSETEKSGLKTFIEIGCASCHSGSTLGGMSYQKLGAKKAYPDEDLGRFTVTKKEVDRSKFKVPILRNISETAPYFHNGKVQTLDEAVELMARHQLDQELSPSQKAEIVAFLRSLTGEVPADYIAAPKLP